MSMEYQIVTGGHGDVQSEVARMLAAGWELHGSIAAVPIPPNNYRVFQAMTRRANRAVFESGVGTAG